MKARINPNLFFFMLIAVVIVLLFMLIDYAYCQDEAVVKNELYYSAKFCGERGGITEYLLPDKTRIDCLDDHVAWEVEYAKKPYEASGQCMHYASLTGRRPGVAFITSRETFFDKDWKYIKRFINYMSYHKIDYTLELIVKEDYEE